MVATLTRGPSPASLDEMLAEELGSEHEYELLGEITPARPGCGQAPASPCVQVPLQSVGAFTAGRFAEAIVLMDYLRQRPASLFRDQLYFDNEGLNIPRVPARNLGSFMGVDRLRVRGVNCPCNHGRMQGIPLSQSINMRPDVVDLARREFYEVKPDSPTGCQAGRDKLNYLRCVLDCLLNHRTRIGIAPERYPRRLNMGATFHPRRRMHFNVPVPGIGRVTIILEMRPAGAGLIAYRFCVRGQLSPQLLAELARRLQQWLRDAQRRFRRQLEQMTGPLPDLVAARRAVQEAARQVQQIPNPPQPVRDVYDEIAARLIRAEFLYAYMAAMILAPVIIVLMAEAAPAVLAAVARFGAAATAYLAQFARVAQFTGAGALQFALAVKQAHAAEQAATEARQASNPQARQAAQQRARTAAAAAQRHAQAAQQASRQAQQAEQRMAQARPRVDAGARELADAAQRSGAPAADVARLRGQAGRVGTLTGETTQVAGAMRRAAGGFAQGASGAAGRARQAAGSGGGGGVSACTSVTQAIARIVGPQGRNIPFLARLGFSVSTERVPPGRTQFRVVNASGAKVIVLFSAPTCRSIVLENGTSQTLDVRPGVVHRVAAQNIDPAVPEPRIPGFGEHRYQAGRLHVMRLIQTRP